MVEKKAKFTQRHVKQKLCPKFILQQTNCHTVSAVRTILYLQDVIKYVFSQDVMLILFLVSKIFWSRFTTTDHLLTVMFNWELLLHFPGALHCGRIVCTSTYSTYTVAWNQYVVRIWNKIV